MTRLTWVLALAAATLAIGEPSAPAARTRALWVWDAAPLLADAGARAGFLEFCRAHGIGVVWIQVGTAAVGRGRTLARSEQWRTFLADAHRAAIKVHALDGDPTYALPEHHAEALAVVDAIADFNIRAPANQRFDGIHFDNEPHALLDWQEPSRRERLLEAFLDLNARAHAKAHDTGIEYGIDIPFWWQARDEDTGEAAGAVTFRGVRKPASLHCLDLLDNVGIMDYRTVAAGDDGIVAHARELIDYAAAGRRANVFVGVETSKDADAPYRFVAGVPRNRFRDIVAGRAPGRDTLTRARLAVVSDGAAVHLGVRATPRTGTGDPPDATAALIEIARLVGAPTADDGQRWPAADAAIAALRREGEWRDAERDTLVDPATGRVYAAVRATRTMLPKLTFAGRPNDEMERELAATDAAFSARPSYAGIAIHHWNSYRAMTR